MSRSHASRRRRALAAVLLPVPAGALATTYDLSNQNVYFSTLSYNADDVINASNVTFSPYFGNVRLRAAVNLVGNGTANAAAPITFSGALSGSATLTKIGDSSLTLAALSPSFTGPLTVSTGTFRLGIESPLAGTGGSLTLGAATTLDLNGFNSPGRTITYSSGNWIVNNNTTATSTLSSLPANTSLNLGGIGTLNLTAPLQNNTSYTKTGTGTLVLSAASPSFNGTLTVETGILQLGLNAPFTGATTPSIYLATGAAYLDLNGFSPGTVPISLSQNATLVNNNLATPATLTSLASITPYSGPLPLGGAGTINLTAKAISLIKNGTGTLDLNGYPAPGGTYSGTGMLANYNTATPSAINLPTSHLPSGITFAGDGDLVTTGTLPSNFFKSGTGNLIANTPQALTATLLGGTLRLAGPGSYSGNLTLYGTNVGNYFDHYGPGALLDVYGTTSPSFPSLTLYNNFGVVNNNPNSTSTFTGSVTVASNASAQNLTFGGDGNLVIPNSLPIPSTVTLNKVGAGLLVLSTGQAPRGVNLRAGTYQAEADGQLGQTVAFLGGTLRVTPYFLAPKSSYTFSAAISVDPAGGIIDTQRDTTLTGAFSGTGTLTKSGTATLTLSNSPSAAVNFSLAAGTLRFAPALADATIGSLSITPAATLDLRNTSFTTTTPYSLLRQYLHDALLTSSTADPTHVLGCKDTNPGTYFIRLTLRGDANLDGVLNADDYALLDQGFAQHASTWWQGDFNYDGTVDQLDYFAIDSTYGQAHALCPEFLSTRESRFGADYVSTLLAAVPEPSSLACLFAAIPLLSRRRRP